jgi:protein gp37
MSNTKTGIEWTDATWSPVTGCSKVSPGCAHCYAETLALTRLAGRPGYPGLPWTPENAAANVVLHPDRLDLPLRWRTPRRVFVNSMSDLFHERVPAGFVDEVFAAMMLAPQHTFQVLTKRPERMAKWASASWGGYNDPLEDRGDVVRGAAFELSFMHAIAIPEPWDWPLPNVWLGTSIENDRFVGRADALRETPAAVRFISAEPLLGPLPSLDLTGIDWLIVGGESGPGARPARPEWVRDLRDRAGAARVPFFFKGWGGRTPRAGGRELDGRTWDEYP